MNKESEAGWNRLDGWGEATSRILDRQEGVLGTFGGHLVKASEEVVKRIEHEEMLCSIGKLDAQSWMGSKDLLALHSKFKGGK